MLNTDTYTTISGDTWDIVAYRAYGNEMYTDTLIKANIEHKDTYIFPAGVVLTLPEIDLSVSESLPPWKQGVTVSE
jgi:phage tail protein X